MKALWTPVTRSPAWPVVYLNTRSGAQLHGVPAWFGIRHWRQAYTELCTSTSGVAATGLEPCPFSKRSWEKPGSRFWLWTETHLRSRQKRAATAAPSSWRSSWRCSERTCLLYTSDAADDLLCVDLGGRRIIKKKKKKKKKQ